MRAAACAASGLLLAAAHVVSALAGLTCVALVPLCLALRPRHLAQTWGGLALAYGLFTLFTLLWVRRYQFDPATVRLLLPAASLYLCGFLVVPAVALRLGARDAGIALLPAGIAAAELLMRRVGLECSWALVGQPLVDWPGLARLAAVLGPEGPSFVAVATNVSIAVLLRNGSASRRRLTLLQGPVLLVGLLAWGLLPPAPASGPSLRVGVVQPDTPADRKWDPEQRSDVLAVLDQLIDRAVAGGAEIVVLPETALGGYVRYEDDLTAWARAAVVRTRLPLLFGSLDRPESSSQAQNVAVLITPYGTVQTYAKVRLVPAAEYRPNPWGLATALFGPSPLSLELHHGPALRLFELEGGIRFLPVICWEEMFPDLLRRAGATPDFVVSLVNTEAFDGTSEPRQQLRRARLTAAALGLPLVRVSNDGVSGIIDPRGRLSRIVTDSRGVSHGTQAAGVVVLDLESLWTPYRAFGDASPLVILSCVVALTGLVARQGRVGSSRAWGSP